MKNRVKQILIVTMAAVLALPAMAQWNTRDEQQDWSAQAPSATFQSTSTMPSSGSAYSSTPKPYTDGTTEEADASPSGHPGKPKTVAPPTPEGDPTPIGDGMWVLMLLALGYCAYVARNRARAVRMRDDA